MIRFRVNPLSSSMEQPVDRSGETRVEGAAKRRGDVERARREKALEVAGRKALSSALLQATAQSYVTEKAKGATVTVAATARAAGISSSTLGRAVQALGDGLRMDLVADNVLSCVWIW